QAAAGEIKAGSTSPDLVENVLQYLFSRAHIIHNASHRGVHYARVAIVKHCQRRFVPVDDPADQSDVVHSAAQTLPGGRPHSAVSIRSTSAQGKRIGLIIQPEPFPRATLVVAPGRPPGPSLQQRTGAPLASKAENQNFFSLMQSDRSPNCVLDSCIRNARL